jgi:hypothetical protein
MSTTPITRIDIFPHTGNRIPESLNSAGGWSDTLTEDDRFHIVERNRDTGLDRVIESFKTNPENRQIVLAYDYARAITDANRLLPSAQVPKVTFTGEALFSAEAYNTIAPVLIKNYIRPWHRKIIEVVRQNPQATIIHWHTFDTVSYSKTSNVSQSGGIRPLGQIITSVDTVESDFKPYLEILRPSSPQLESGIQKSVLIKPELIDKIDETFTRKLRHYSTFSSCPGAENAENFVADTPYKAFGAGKEVGLLTSLISAVTANEPNRQLVFEIRKDVFHNEAAIRASREGVNEVLALMAHA